MVRACHGRGMANVNQTRLHCVNQMGKTYSKTLEERHGRGTAWARHAICESALRSIVIYNFMSNLGIYISMPKLPGETFIC
jgi:hypothetical protein